jgi:hypothetical protein
MLTRVLDDTSVGNKIALKLAPLPSPHPATERALRPRGQPPSWRGRSLLSLLRPTQERPLSGRVPLARVIRSMRLRIRQWPTMSTSITSSNVLIAKQFGCEFLADVEPDTPISCEDCGQYLGTWDELLTDLEKQSGTFGVFQLEKGRIRRIG